MEELKLNTNDIPLITSEKIERIEPDEIEPKEKKVISLYFLLTASAFIFIIAFAFSDLGYKLIKGGTEKLPTILMGSVFGEKARVEISLSEYLSKSILGIEKINSSELITDDSVQSEDEQAGNKNTPVAADTLADSDYGETSAAVPETEPHESEAETKYPIEVMDLSQKQLGEYYIGNETGYSPDIRALLESDFSVPEVSINEKDQPLVLIIHTHGTEAYMYDDTDFYIDDGGDISRTNDTERNVIHIGKLMTETLISKGINTLHCEVMHDKESYQDSYTKAAETIREYLSKYPSIKYVFDVHRDAIMKSDGSLVKAVTEIDGKNVAQVMTVVGSSYKGASFPDWEGHLSLALKLKKRLDEKYDRLSRPVYLRGAAYNQQYTPGSLLLEIGTSGNTLEEAERAAVLVAETLADLITDRK